MGINEVIQIGNRIKKIRTKKGLTQKEMSELTGIPYSTYSNYENNNREPNAAQLKKIAQALNISLQNLITSGSITSEMEFDTDEEATLYLDILSNLEKMNIKGFEETKHYTSYLISNDEYIEKNEPPHKITQLKAAHNDHAAEPGELEKMQEDLETLKRPDK